MGLLQVFLFRVIHCDRRNPAHFQALGSAVCDNYWNLFHYLAQPLAYGRHTIVGSHHYQSNIDYKSMSQSHKKSLSLSEICVYSLDVYQVPSNVSRNIHPDYCMNSRFPLPDYVWGYYLVSLPATIEHLCWHFIYWSSAHVLETPSYFLNCYLSRSFQLRSRSDIIGTHRYHCYLPWLGTRILELLNLRTSNF